jgi:hypothetical protein
MLTERKELGYYKEEQRDFVEVFLYEIEKQEAAKGTTNLEPADAFTGTKVDFAVPRVFTYKKN